MRNNKVIGAGTIQALEQIRELMDDDNEEEHPNLTLTDVCIELVDSYDGDDSKDEIKKLLEDLQEGVDTVIEPDQGAGPLINAANAVIRFFDNEEAATTPTERPSTR